LHRVYSAFTLHQGLVLRRWHNPRLDQTEQGAIDGSKPLADVQHATLFECVPYVVVVIACSHTSLNRYAREAVVAGALKAQAELHSRFVCVQAVIDTQPVACDDVLPLAASLFDCPPKPLIHPQSKVILITSSDDTFSLRPPLSLSPSCLRSINSVIDASPDLRPRKTAITHTILTAYESCPSPSSATLVDVLVLKASLRKHCMHAETSLDDALDAAYPPNP